MLSFIGERHVIHDDEFIERRNQRVANHGVGNAKKAVSFGVSFDLRLDAALWIEKKRNDSLPGRQVLDVVGKNGVEVAQAVGASESEIGAIIFVDQRHGFACRVVFGEPVGAEVIRQRATEPGANGGACSEVHGQQRRLDGGVFERVGHDVLL